MDEIRKQTWTNYAYLANKRFARSSPLSFSCAFLTGFSLFPLVFDCFFTFEPNKFYLTKQVLMFWGIKWEISASGFLNR